MTTFERVVDLLNDAALETDQDKKVNQLHQVQELIVHKEPNLLDNFLDEMLAFQSDQEAEVRKLIAGFIEDALNADEESIPKVLTSLSMLLTDEAVSVTKRAILTAGAVYSKTFKWLSGTTSSSDIQKQCWEFVNGMKQTISSQLQSSDNEGVKAHVVRYIESLIMCLSRPAPPINIATNEDNKPEPVKELSLDLVPESHGLLKVNRLEAEGRRLFESLVTFTSSEAITSQTLMAIVTSVASIATCRPSFMLAAVELLEALHVDLPPRLGKSQVSSVRKCLKMQLMRLAKAPQSGSLAAELSHRISTLLSDLGATQQEIAKLMPKTIPTTSTAALSSLNSGNKRKLSASTQPKEPEIKRQAVDLEDDDDDNAATEQQTAASYVDKLTDELLPRLNLQNVVDLVLSQMNYLPEVMPAQFAATYTPISAAGTPQQVRHMSRLLSSQVLSSAIGRAYIASSAGQDSKSDPSNQQQQQGISRILGGSVVDESARAAGQKPSVELPKLGQRQVGQQRTVIRPYKLSDVTSVQLNREQLQASALSSIRRALRAESNMAKTKLHGAWIKLVSCLGAMFSSQHKHALFEYCCEDLRGRFDLIVSWLAHEYAVGRGYLTAFDQNQEQKDDLMQGYDEWLTRVLMAVYEKTSPKLGLFGQLLLASPSLTPGALSVLRLYCLDENCSYSGMAVLAELLLDRSAERQRLLPLLLEFSLCCSQAEKAEQVRNNAVRELQKLYKRFMSLEELEDSTRQQIEDFAVASVRSLQLPTPPQDLFAESLAPPAKEWSDELVRCVSALYLSLMPLRPVELLPVLAEVHVGANAEARKPLLKLLEQPIKQLGMQSPALLDFISTSQRGTETLVARIVAILTSAAEAQGQPVTYELVQRVYGLYQNRVDDVRFLLPVLGGLSKKQTVGILPDVIKLNAVVVKEVFARIIGAKAVSPAELLVELHALTCSADDADNLKLVIKCVNLLLADRQHYTQEVMAVVLQQLIDLNPLPVLLMRTLLQSLAIYPRLIGLSMSIMHRLIQKQVWKQARLWDGFIRCCQQTKPRSFEVLLQLPVAQLRAVVDEAARDLKAPLIEHIRSLSESALAQLPRATIQALLMNDDGTMKMEEAEDVKEDVKTEQLDAEKAAPMDSS